MMIDIWGAVAVLLLIVGAFFGGMATADRYNEKAKREERHSLEVQYARLKANVDYNSPSGPYVSPLYSGDNLRCSGNGVPKRGFSLSQMHSFEERLRNTGSATVLLKNNSTKNNKEKGE